MASTIPTPLLLSQRDQAIPVLLDAIQRHASFLVTSHARPDGDAIGSSLGAMFLLEALGKQVTVVMADPVPRTFLMLPGTERILSTQPAVPAEVGLVLECDSVPRTGFDHLAADLLFNIDHHSSGVPFASINWIDPDAPAVGAMLYDLAVAAGISISPALATCLYTAVLTDTVHFTLPSTTAATFALAEHLVRRGADAAGIAEEVYHSHRPSRLRVLAAALSRFEMSAPVAWSAILQEEIEAAGAEVEDCESVVNYVIGVAGVRAAAFLRELPGGRFRASLRSKGDVDVARIAETLGGGGHRNASGCTLNGPLAHALDQILPLLQSACTGTALPPASPGGGSAALLG